MDWKNFFKPYISKIVIFILLVLIFGVPATSRGCQGYVTTPTPPACIERFTFSNIINDVLGGTKYPYMLDASIHFSYNPLLIIPYLIGVYMIVSLIFHIAGYNWKKALLYTVAAMLLIFLIIVLSSVMGTKIGAVTFVK